MSSEQVAIDTSRLIYPKLGSLEAPGEGAGLFGLNHELGDSLLRILPVAWEGSTSQGSGTSQCFDGLLRASHYVDLFHERYGDAYRAGIACCPDTLIASKKAQAKCSTDNEGRKRDAIYQELYEALYLKTQEALDSHSIPLVVGGDHSAPLASLVAIGENRKKNTKDQQWGVLHLDAHLDMRSSYEGVENSHASIMYHASRKAAGLTKIVSLGIRDYCKEEMAYASSIGACTLTDRAMRRALAEGASLKGLLSRALAELPQNVYLSFDIDGLDMANCPATGTPVPGGFQFYEMQLLLDLLVESGRAIVGADLCEIVCSGERPEESLDANVGSRVLWEMCNAIIASQIGAGSSAAGVTA